MVKAEKREILPGDEVDINGNKFTVKRDCGVTVWKHVCAVHDQGFRNENALKMHRKDYSGCIFLRKCTRHGLEVINGT